MSQPSCCTSTPLLFLPLRKGSYYTIYGALELGVLLLQAPDFWDCRQELPYPAKVNFFKQEKLMGCKGQDSVSPWWVWNGRWFTIILTTNSKKTIKVPHQEPSCSEGNQVSLLLEHRGKTMKSSYRVTLGLVWHCTPITPILGGWGRISLTQDTSKLPVRIQSENKQLGCFSRACIQGLPSPLLGSHILLGSADWGPWEGKHKD